MKKFILNNKQEKRTISSHARSAGGKIKAKQNQEGEGKGREGKGWIEKREEGIIGSHFGIDQSGEVDHYILGSPQPVWVPWNTWDSSCSQQPPEHSVSLYSALWMKTPMKTLHYRTNSLLLLRTHNPCSHYTHQLPFLDPPLLSYHSSSLCNKPPPSVSNHKLHNILISNH